MQQSEQPKKYQLSPKASSLLVPDNITRDVGGEKAIPTPWAPRSDKTDKHLGSDGLKKRLNNHGLVRRRNTGRIETGPMTTVQEMAMDSPTIPGCLLLHERSSVPSDLSRKHQLTHTFNFVPGNNEDREPQSACNKVPQVCPQKMAFVSPKDFASLVATQYHTPLPLLECQQPLNCFPKKGNSLRPCPSDGSPPRQTAFITNSFIPSFTTPHSAATNATSCATLPTPVSNLAMVSQTASPKRWDGRYTPLTLRRKKVVLSEATKKWPDLRTRNYPILQWTEPKKAKILEPEAFEQLPSGWTQVNALGQFKHSELSLLQKQAIDQVGQFEVLKAADVKILSEELHHLDERTEYLRRVYGAFRHSRRNLHTRIYQYLSSPHSAKFSHKSIAAQKEALAELDDSIDDWMNKLAQVENRRSRVHQKLLEHTAAVACLTIGRSSTTPESKTKATALGAGNTSTASRIPLHEAFTSAHTASSSTSSQRAVVRVLSTIVE
ncbi:hypothetical protein Forpi1262_v013796 [Fusarium oxysporum f. sp. raphani]|uniref:Up-regulated during septation protein 1 domain-containing protein n=1 Tax=Fusarium oxysporum f. sp. raphani TaxID=96318 RepID=A0A8J5PSP0_FUSOX|nr:hypothetical protein FocnCong_v010747 [Fusarium oxysporum f. sp. conglutinans]KAG7425085.1 hypothetical protein Forpi1262_v013796 [Fusarium oxysporum f. sp. raphani]